MNNKDDKDDDDTVDDDDDNDPHHYDQEEESVKEISQDLVQCPACLRRMCPEVFSKHPKVCRENPSNKRSVRIFDMTQYRSIRSGDKILPVRKVSPSNTNKPNNNNNNYSNTRPSQTRSAKRIRRPDVTVVPPVINNFCM